MPGMTTRLPHIDYYLTIRSGTGNEKTILTSYTTLNHTSKNGKVLTIGNRKSN